MRRAYDCMMVQTHASEHVYLSFRTAVEERAQVGDIIHVEHETFGTLQFRVVEVLQETIGKRPLVIWTDRPLPAAPMITQVRNGHLAAVHGKRAACESG